MRRLVVLGLMARLVLACSPDTGGTGVDASTGSDGGMDARDSGVPQTAPTNVTPGAALSIPTETVLSSAVESAHLLASGEVLAATGDGVVLVGPAGDSLALMGSVGAIHAAVLLEGTLLIAAEAGFFVLQGHELVRSPLSDAVDGNAVRALFADGSSLWLHSTDGIRLFDGSVVRAVDLPGVQVSSATVSFGGALEGNPALWVLSDGALHAVQRRDGNVQAWRIRSDLQPAALAADGAGRVWLRVDGDVHLQEADGSWRWLRLPHPVQEILADAAGTDAWVRTSMGSFLYADGAFRPVGELPSGTVLGAGVDGRLLISQASALTQLRARRRMEVLGLPEGPVLQPLSVTLVPEEAGAVMELSARIGEVTLEVTTERMVMLSPAQLGEGPHVLEVEARYSDGALPALGRAAFTVENVRIPTWTTDIQPIAQTQCLRCHGDMPGATAHRLHTLQLWQDEIDEILDAVRNGRMPLAADPLTPAQITLISEWANANFPE